MFGFVLGVGSDELTVKNITSQEKKLQRMSQKIYIKKNLPVNVCAYLLINNAVDSVPFPEIIWKRYKKNKKISVIYLEGPNMNKLPLADKLLRVSHVQDTDLMFRHKEVCLDERCCVVESTL